jgi:16S rRNA (cytosine1402-N4)-methyltransferase
MNHIPIMVEEILGGLLVNDTPDAIWIDGTLGAGGHSHAMLSERADSRLLGLDLDPNALQLAAERLANFGERAVIRQASYEFAPDVLREACGVDLADGILLDLGISSMQIDDPARGFAFRLEGALDMRFDPASNRATAADLVNELAAEELADLFYRYGEEQRSRPIARAIVEARPITSTLQLAQVVADSVPKFPQKQKIHPATRVFQALRIAVNDELGVVERSIPRLIDLLKPGARLAVMSFHSLEDRIVKQIFKHEATDCICPPKQPICTCDHHASLKLITRKPLIAAADEVADNPRARSAKLRIAEKI